MTTPSAAITAFFGIFWVKKLLDALYDGGKARISMLLGVDGHITKLKADFEQLRGFLALVEEKKLTQLGFQGWIQELKDLVYDAEDVVNEFETAVEMDPGLACSTNSDPKQGTFATIVGTDFVKGATEFLRFVKQDLLDLLGGNKAEKDVSSSSKYGRILVRLRIAEEIEKILEKLEVLREKKDSFDLLVELSGRSAPEEESGRKLSQRQQVGSRPGNKFKMVGREKEREDLIYKLIGIDGVSVLSIVGMGGIGKSTLAQLVYNDLRVSNHFEYRKWFSVGERFDLQLLIEKLIEETIVKGTQMDELQERLTDKLSEKRFMIVLDDVWDWGQDHQDWEYLWNPLSYVSKGGVVLITSRNERVVQTTSFKPTIELQPLDNDECMSVFLRHAFPNGDFDEHPRLKSIARKIVGELKGLPLAAKVVGSSLFNNFDVKRWNNVLKDKLWATENKEKSNIMNQLKWSYNLLSPHLKQCFGYCSIFPKDHDFHVQQDLVLKWMAAGLIQPERNRMPEDVGMEYFEELLQKSFFDRIEEKYKMHDLIHDLAQLVSFPECSCYQRAHSSSSVRHLSLDTSDTDSKYDFQKVRTIFHSGVIRQDDFFQNLKYIRILDLSRLSHSLDIDKFKHISCLKHLRYLKCSLGGSFPPSLVELYNLQVLIVTDREYVSADRIKEMHKLSKLRHLEAPKGFFYQIESIGGLTALQSLKLFSIRKEHGYGIEELQNLRQLHGRLHINNLENVETVEKAKKSSLIDKECLTELTLEWSEIDHRSELKDILEALKPHRKLQKLSICKYGGMQLPEWLTECDSLHHLSLKECNSLEGLSRKMGKSLDSLHIRDLVNFSFDGTVFKKLTDITQMVILGCPKFCKDLSEYITGMLHQSPSGSVILPLLKVLEIDDTQLFSAFLGCGNQFCIQEICFSWSSDSRPWNQIMQTEQLRQMTSLKKLCFYNLNRDDLPSYLYLLPSVEKLEILFCEKIQELPRNGLPNSVQHLRIAQCQDLYKRYNNKYGPDREKIAFIPHIDITPSIPTIGEDAATESFSGVFCLEKLYDMACDLSKEGVSLRLGVSEEIRKLIDDLDLIQKFLKGVDEKQRKQSKVQEWLRNLQDLVYDAEDVLDEFVLKSETGTLAGRRRINITKLARKKIKTVLDDLGSLLKRKDKLDLSVPISHQRNISISHQRTKRPYVESKLRYKKVMVGRERERQELLVHLTGRHTDSNVAVTSIVGMGGMGKSTLAQLVYDDKQVTSHFTYKKWLSVGEKFDPEKLLGETELQVSGQRFLIVLDDVWNTSGEIWVRLWIPLTHGSKGSRVLITCRDKQVVQATGFKPTIELQPLKDDECLSVFLEHAFPDGDSDDYPDLKRVAEKIVGKLKGLPLAAKVLGSSLFNNIDKDAWNNILEDELWANVEEGEDSVMNQLKWSYNLLPPHLKQCFGYCSIFPKDHIFIIQRDLVLKWMAAGLIQPKGSIRPEDIGMDYFQDLLQKSFFDHFDETRYVMHDLIHDLAELVSSHECACYERLKTVDSDTSSVRHLSLDTFTTGSPYNFQKVRTVLYMGMVVPDGFFNKLKYTRVLDLTNKWHSGIIVSDVHAEQISRLKHLRYLRCRTENTIPKSFGKLYNLQVLVMLFDFLKVTSHFDPIKGISDLSKLRHIQLLFSRTGTSWIESIGRLTALQSLEEFTVRKIAGFGIEELQCLAQLRGRLHISGLENVETKEEAEKSNLVDKKHLNELELKWNGRQTISQSEQKHILEALKPNPNLEKLTFDGYGGEQLPRWLADASSLSSLELWKCGTLLFNDDNLFRNLIQLRHLKILRCPQFSNGLCGFITGRVEQNASVSFVLPNLETLEIDDTRLFGTLLGSGDLFWQASSVKEMICSGRHLQGLDIDDTRLFSTFLGSGNQFCTASLLKEIELWFTKDTGLGLWNENMQTEQLSRFTSLKILRFLSVNCSELPSYLYLLPSLEELEIAYCDQILELPKYGLPKSLQVLTIDTCKQLVPRCREGGPEWEKIKSIPNLKLNRKVV